MQELFEEQMSAQLGFVVGLLKGMSQEELIFLRDIVNKMVCPHLVMEKQPIAYNTSTWQEGNFVLRKCVGCGKFIQEKWKDED